MRALLLAIALLFPVSLFAQEAPTAPTPDMGGVAPAQLTEHVMGDPAAKVTVIEYASLTCPHCAHFSNDILPKVVEKYVSTGKIKIVYRDFPFDGLALRAAILAQCLPEERYFVFIKTLFANQPGWLQSKDPDATLQQYAKLAGLPGERVNSCLSDKAMMSAMLKRRNDAEQQFKINATPSFVINYGEETFAGIDTIEAFDKSIAKYIK